MPDHDLLTDEYVAEVLAKEAADHSLRYSSMGMEASKTDKKPANMPKPNTRFLSRIIRSTNSHNASLLAAEAAESQARLKQLEKTEERQKRRVGAPSDIRKRQMGDIKAILGGGSSRSAGGPRRTDRSDKGNDEARPRHKRRSASPERERDRRRHRQRSAERERDRTSSRRHTAHEERRSRSPRDKERRSRRTSRSPGGDGRSSRSHKERERHVRRSHRDHSTEGRKRDRSPRSGPSRSDRRKEQAARSESDSDPLGDIIGPAPPKQVRVRGRGFDSGRSGIDKRFEEGYDPKMDLELDDAPDDWDDAVETFRDRKRWEQSQEQRMRAAGFGDEDIKKWKKGGQPDEEDVRWTKAGEKREWDRGKEEKLSGLFSFGD